MEYWIWLSQLKGIGPVTQRKLLQYFGTPNRIFTSSEEELRSIGGIGPILAQTIQKAHSLAELKIQAVLIDSSKTVDQIASLTGIDQVELIEHLSIMEMEGIIEFCAGGRFVLAGLRP